MANSRLFGFRYPFDIAQTLESWRDKLGSGLLTGRSFDDVMGHLADRDRALEDYLGFMSQGRLAYATSTDFTLFTTTNASTDLTSLTVTVTIPANRVLRVTGQAVFDNVNDGAGGLNYILEGWVNEDGTDIGHFGYLGLQVASATTSSAALIQSGSIIITPAAGTHTYKLVGKTGSTGTGTSAIGGLSASPAFILVEDIGPTNP